MNVYIYLDINSINQSYSKLYLYTIEYVIFVGSLQPNQLKPLENFIHIL